MDPSPGQRQLFDVQPTARAWSAENLPKYEDVVLTAQQVEQAALEWPTKTPGQQIGFMKKRVHNQMLHEIVVDPITGRRAFGGPQPGTAGKEKKRLDESLVEAADNRIDELIDAAFSSVGPENASEVRHKSALNIIKVSQEMKRLEQRDDELERASREDLEDLAAEILAKAVRDGKLSTTDFNLTEADVVELGP